MEIVKLSQIASIWLLQWSYISSFLETGNELYPQLFEVCWQFVGKLDSFLLFAKPLSSQYQNRPWFEMAQLMTMLTLLIASFEDS